MTDLPAEGRIDIHSHLLPDLDDGCRSVDEALAIIEILMDAGFVGSVCTPHLWPEQWPEYTPAFVADRVSELREAVQEAGLDYRLWAGGELRISPRSLAWIQEVGVPTLAGGRCVLVDHWGAAWPDEGDPLIDYLFEHGYQPILAHPARLGFPCEEMAATADRLRDRGVWFQGNLNCLAGGEGDEAAMWIRRWLREGRYHVIATDAHRPHAMDGRLEGLALLEIEVGPDKAANLLETAPRRVLGAGS